MIYCYMRVRERLHRGAQSYVTFSDIHPAHLNLLDSCVYKTPMPYP